MITPFVRLALGAALAIVASPAFAQDSGVPPVPAAPPSPADVDGGDRITIAAGVASVPDFVGSDDNSWIPAAAVVGRVSGFDFFTRGTQLYVDLLPDRPGPGTNFELGVIGGVRLDRSGDIDDVQVAALGEVDTAYEVGGFVGITRTGVITSDYDTLTARIAFVHDVSDTYDSYVITPQVNYTTPLSRRALVSLGVSADYVGKGYSRTYFQVTPAQSAFSGLPTYIFNDSGFNRLNFSLFGVHSLTGDLLGGLGIGAGVQYGRLLGDTADSPIVRDRDQWAFAAGLTYTF